MSKYTTGEIAKLCGVSVRTVQYYDSRNILVPSALSEGGRRLYSEADLDKMKIICFLRSLELPIDSIKALLEQEHSEEVLCLLLDEQEKQLQAEILQKQQSVERIAQARRTLRKMELVSARSVGDIAYLMENKKKLNSLYAMMVAVGLIMDALQAAGLMLWILEGIWWPFAAMMPLVIGLGIWISWIYFHRAVYICPQCHRIFKPKFKEAFFARHTPWTRKLTCPDCGYWGFCVESYDQEKKKC